MFINWENKNDYLAIRKSAKIFHLLKERYFIDSNKCIRLEGNFFSIPIRATDEEEPFAQEIEPEFNIWEIIKLNSADLIFGPILLFVIGVIYLIKIVG